MKKEIKILTLSSLCVLLFLIISGSFSGVLQRIIYIIGFVLPTFVFLYIYYGRKNGGKIFTSEYLTLGKKEAFITLGVIFPTVLSVLLVSLLGTAVMACFGKENIIEINEPPYLAVLLHALLPAFLEETAFRYLPLRLMGKRAPRGAIFVSATLFALVHHSLFSISYAFVAGIVFMAVDLMTESVFPSLIIHFVNNLFSLLAMGALGIEIESYVVFLLLLVLCLLSFIPLFIYRSDILLRARLSFAKGEGISRPTELLFLAVPSLLIAFFELWG